MRIIETPSPNFGTRNDVVVDMLVLHYTGMKTAAEALARLCDPAAQVSAHYVVDEDGSVHALVPETARAWHAGLSRWRGGGDVNSRSIGIEIVNPGHEFGYRPFPGAQIAALIELCAGILGRHPIPARNVVGHSDVAPLRKQDPGELFPWPELAAAGIGPWPFSGGETAPIPGVKGMLAEYGYEVTDFPAALRAFQRHFRPERIDGVADGETAGRIARLLSHIA
jgi:N-acetylmuramoyl-L-alanine amidase